MQSQSGSAVSDLSTSLTNCQFCADNGSGVATDLAVSGDLSLANTGAFSIIANAVTVSKGAVVVTRRTCALVSADNAAVVLVNGDCGPQGQVLLNVAAPVVGVEASLATLVLQA
jgi:hypothetical protein